MFEEEMSSEVDGRTCIAVSSGTSALHLMLLAFGIGPGSEVIVPSFTFAATANAVRLAGGEPVFADVRFDDFCLDIDDVRSRVTDRTAAVLTVHLYGQTGDMGDIAAFCAQRGLALFEDAAQASGARYEGRPVGTLGTAAAFSFYATKNMTTCEGGMVVVDDESAARTIRLLRSQGMAASGTLELVGHNARMTDVAAAIGHVQRRRLVELNGTRRQHAARYDDALRGMLTPAELEGRTHAWNQYTVRIPEGRDAVADALRTTGVQSAVYYRAPLHRQSMYDSPARLPVTDRLASEVLSLPVHPGLTEADVDHVAGAVLASSA